jgi:hypothetical protein
MSSSLEGRTGTTLGGRFFNENHHSGEGLSTGSRARGSDTAAYR